MSGSCSRLRWPWIRICGGVLVAMCRSDPSTSTIVFSSSGSVGIVVLRIWSSSHLVIWSRRWTNDQVTRRPDDQIHVSLDRFADDLFNRRHAVLHLAQAAAA